jgi:hypothetical protein|tara:strand:- start:33 stop:209 length:177 start_codon:yes stop_codon:yes gene_type:complete
MTYTNAKYHKHEGEINNTYIEVDINGITSVVPISEENRDYAEIMELVKEGELTIEAAD